MIEFSIIDATYQRFGAILNRRRVTLTIKHNLWIDRWSFDLAIDDLPVLHGRRIVTGVDLLRPYDFGIGLMFADSESGEAPGRDQMVNGRVKLYHAAPEEVA